MIFFEIHLFYSHRKVFLCSKGRCTYDVHESCPIFKNPHPLVQQLPNSSTHLTSDVQSQAKRKDNPGMTIRCYQVFPSGWLLFSLSTH